MIDVEKLDDAELERAFAMVLSRVHVETRILSRLSHLVRCRIGGDNLDFRITYVGPSRPRQANARRAAQDDVRKS